MPTPKQGYYNAAGKRIPGVTTIISRFKDAGGLIHWAWDQGRNGLDYRQTRDTAASIGTLVHGMVEASIQGTEMPSTDGFMPEQLTQAANGLQAFKDWYAGSGAIIEETEIKLVSEQHQFGGTPDAVGMVNGKRCILDWKSGSVYSDALCQVAAYGVAYTENTGKTIEGFHIIRFSKENGDFVHRHYASLPEALEQFLLFRRAYEIDKLLKARAK